MARSHSWEAIASSARSMTSLKVSRVISSAFIAALGLYFLSRARASFLNGVGYRTTLLTVSMISFTALGRWWTPVLMLLWVNLHAGYALGIALMALFMIGDALDVAFGFDGLVSQTGTPHGFETLAVAIVACVAVVPVKPVWYGDIRISIGNAPVASHAKLHWRMVFA